MSAALETVTLGAPEIHPTAIVDDGARLGAGTKVGPYCMIGPNVVLGEGCELIGHVVLAGHTTIGARCRFYPFASIGHAPQDLRYRGEPTTLTIGDGDCIVREGVTMNPGTPNGKGKTTVGDRCFLLAHSHVAHDCIVGSNVILTNNVMLAGHCEIGDFAILGGGVGIHQFVRIGTHAFIGGLSAVENDVIPYGMVIGNRAYLSGLNIIGLRRRGFTREQIHDLRRAYRLLFAAEGTLTERVVDVAEEFASHPTVHEILDFIRLGGGAVDLRAARRLARDMSEAGRLGPVGEGAIAILAGSGELPIRLADRLSASGHEVRILAFRGFCERRLKARADAVVNLLDLRRIVATLESWRPAALTLAGALRRPSASALIGAYSAYRDRDYVASVVSRGDDNLLRGAIELLESKGFPLVGVRELAPELLAEPGIYGRHTPEAGAFSSIECGFRMLDALSPYDVGQAAVVNGLRVVAIEGPEGTDRMLARAAKIARGGLLRRAKRGGVLVKGPKRDQDLRVDLPAIGPRTVANAAKAGLEGIAIAQGLTLVLDRPATIAAADKAGLFLVSVERDALLGGASWHG